MADIAANIMAYSTEWSAYGATIIETKRATYSNAIIAAIWPSYVSNDWTAIITANTTNSIEWSTIISTYWLANVTVI